MSTPRDPVLDLLYVVALYARTVALRTARTRAAFWTRIAEAAVERARTALTDTEPVR